jgi:UDP-N-acetylglucosamine 2-epimerase
MGELEPRGVRAIEPLGYLDVTRLVRASRAVVTDSGGLQKEAFLASVPCVTLREETEWVELVETGCNRLVGADVDELLRAVADFEAAGNRLPENRPANLFGDGNSGARIVELLAEAEPRRHARP